MERKGKLKRGALGVVALLVALIMVAQLFTPAVALAAVSDGDTRDNYQNVFQQGTQDVYGLIRVYTVRQLTLTE